MLNNIENTTNNTSGVVRELEFGNEEMIQTILGPAYKLPKAGVIRPGIKVLKKGCSDSDSSVYNRMTDEGSSWDEIDKRIGKDRKGKSKLIPKNADYFTVRPSDCKNPDDVRLLYDLYADSDGKIRTIPVWFASNEWYNIIPHNLRCFGARSGLRFYSCFREIKTPTGKVIGSERICKFPLSLEERKRSYGKRKWGERPCDPENCPEYQQGECNFGGVINCYIPGIKGIGVWCIPTTSWHSMVNIKSTLETVSGITGGKISGLVNNRAFFQLRKVREMIHKTNAETGTVQKVEQFLIHLDVDIDMTELAAYYEKSQIFYRAMNAAQLLTPQAPPLVNSDDSQAPDNLDTFQSESVEADDHDIELSPSVIQSTGDNRSDGVIQSATTSNKQLSENAELLFKVLNLQCNGERELMKQELNKYTGIDSFYKVTEEQAEKVVNLIRKKNGDHSELDSTNNCSSAPFKLTGEVKKLFDTLTSICDGDEEVISELKKLTGVDSFMKVTEKMAKEAISKLTDAVLEEF